MVLEKKRKEKRREEKSTSFGVKLSRSQVLYQAAQCCVVLSHSQHGFGKEYKCICCYCFVKSCQLLSELPSVCVIPEHLGLVGCEAPHDPSVPSVLPCPALPCPALLCPALPRPALPYPGHAVWHLLCHSLHQAHQKGQVTCFNHGLEL